MAQKSREEGEIGSESGEKGGLPPCSPPLYKEQSTAKSNSSKIAQKTAFEAKGRLYTTMTTGKVIQRLFIIVFFIYTVSDIWL